MSEGDKATASQIFAWQNTKLQHAWAFIDQSLFLFTSERNTV